MSEPIEKLRDEIRYAQRLCERTVRLYRRVQTVGTFVAIVGGGGAISGLAPYMPRYVPVIGTALLAVFGGLMIAIRPADKAASNESDVKKYAVLLRKSSDITATELQRMLDEARQTDAPEIESLRTVAYNDVVTEIGRPDAAIKPKLMNKLMAAIA